MAQQIAQGMVEKTTVIREAVPADSVNERKGRKRPPLFEFLPTVADKDWKDFRYEIHLYRYNPQTEKKMAVEKIFEPIDPFWVQKKYGGGKFNIMLKEDGQLIMNEDFVCEGEPISASSTAHADGGNSAESLTLQAMRLIANPEMQRMQMEMFKNAAIEAMQMIRLQMPTAQDPLQTLRNAKEILGIGNAAPNPMDDLMRQFMTAMIGKMMNPPETNSVKDTIGLIGQLKESGLFGGASPKVDLASSFVSTLPSLLDKAVNGLHEYRLQSEANVQLVRLQRGEMNPNDPKVISVTPGAAQQPAAQPPAQPPPHAVTAETLPPEVQQQVMIQYMMNRLVSAIRQPDATGAALHDFMLASWPEMLDKMAEFNKDTLLQFFKSAEAQRQILGNTILMQVADDPRLPNLLEEFLAAVAEAKKQQ